MNYFKIINGSNILNSVLLMLFALLLIFAPNFILGTLNVVICSIFLVLGISQIISGFSFPGSFFKYTNIISGIFLVILGILCVNLGGVLETVLRILIAIWMLIGSLKRVNFSILLFKENMRKHFTVVLLTAIVMLLCAVYIFVTPNAIIVTLGVIMLVYAALDLLDSILFMVSYKKLF